MTTIQALHQEHLARVLSGSLPKLASQHSQTFIKLADQGVNRNSALPSESLQNRKYLWEEEQQAVEDQHSSIRSQSQSKTSSTNPAEVLPEWYNLHNPRCSRCYLPVVPGVNSVQVHRLPISRNKKDSKAADDREKQRSAMRMCTLCQSHRLSSTRKKHLKRKSTSQRRRAS